jgi:hypothetical protein
MRIFLKIIALILIVLFSVPVVRYRTVSPCGMLKKEHVERVERQVREVEEQALEQASAYGDEAEGVAEEVAGVVEDVTAGIAAGVAETKVRRMSTWECTKELIDLKLGGETDER